MTEGNIVSVERNTKIYDKNDLDRPFCNLKFNILLNNDKNQETISIMYGKHTEAIYEDQSNKFKCLIGLHVTIEKYQYTDTDALSVDNEYLEIKRLTPGDAYYHCLFGEKEIGKILDKTPASEFIKKHPNKYISMVISTDTYDLIQKNKLFQVLEYTRREFLSFPPTLEVLVKKKYIDEIKKLEDNVHADVVDLPKKYFEEL
jgi:hypothetical protein